MTTIRATLIDPQQASSRFAAILRDLRGHLMAGHRFDAVIRPEKRSTAQNRLMWSMLTSLSEQIVWHGQKLSPDDWKTMCTAALKTQRVVPGLEGGLVVMGESTSQMTIAEMTALIDFMDAFGIQRGVDFGEVLAAEPA